MSENTTPEAPAEEQVSMVQVEELLRADEQSEQEPVEEPVEETAEPAPQEEAPDPDMPRGDIRVALREERERRRQAEQRAQTVLQQQAATAQYLAQLNAQQQQKPQLTPPPDFESDPAGHLKYQLDMTNQRLTYLNGVAQQMAAVEQQKQMLGAAAEVVTRAEEKFVDKNPDYYEALDFVRDKYKEKFRVLGVAEEQLDDVVRNDLRQFGIRSLQSGVNPAEKIFQLARVEGYNGPRGDSQRQLANVAKGSAASRVSRSSAPASGGGLSLEEAAKLPISKIAAMSETEFARLMGGA